MRVAKTGGAPQVLASGQAHPAGVAVDDRHVYWLTSTGLHRAPKAGGVVKRLASERPSPAGAILVDATHVYWVAYAGVVRTPKTGGASLVFSGTTQINSLARDATGLYAAALPGKILRIAHPERIRAAEARAAQPPTRDQLLARVRQAIERQAAEVKRQCRHPKNQQLQGRATIMVSRGRVSSVYVMRPPLVVMSGMQDLERCIKRVFKQTNVSFMNKHRGPFAHPAYQQDFEIE
jgi:hypothetical protein